MRGNSAGEFLDYISLWRREINIFQRLPRFFFKLPGVSLTLSLELILFLWDYMFLILVAVLPPVS